MKQYVFIPLAATLLMTTATAALAARAQQTTFSI
jgi:hypothetical protein